MIAPTGVNSGSYNPTNSPTTCPAVASATWAAKASPLPPTPNESLCQCMYNSLSCVVKSTITSDNYGNLFNTICGFGGGSACAGIKTDTVNGVYGAYSMCNSTEMLSFAMDQYYKGQNSQASACNYQGAASVKQSVTPPSSCAALMSQAGSAGTGTVTSNPIGASAAGGSSSSGAAKKGAAASVHVPDFHILAVLAYVTFATMAGAGYMLL